MALLSALRNLLAGLFRGKGRVVSRPQADLSDPDALRPTSISTALGPKATIVEATAGGQRYLLKRWIELPPAARRELLKLINERQPLNGAGVLSVLSSGEKQQDRQTGLVFCVQEYRPRTLKTYLGELGSAPPLPFAARIVRTVAQRLAAAHQRGLVHGSLSSDACYISTSGGADPGEVTLDFIRYTGMDLAQNPAFTIADVFPTGRGYLAPEAMMGNPPDDLSDLYTLGVLAYESFTRALPFSDDGATTTQKVRGMLSAQVRPMSTIRPDVPQRWDAAIGRLLSRDRKQRYRSADEFLKAVDGEL